MYEFVTNKTEFHAELNELVRQFYYANFQQDFSVFHKVEIDKTIRNFVKVNEREFFFEEEAVCYHGKYEMRRFLLRSIKLSLYKALSTALERLLVWGALTGVRPTKLAYELLESGIGMDFISESMQKNYLISSKKSDLIQCILKAQKDYIEREEKYVNLYVHIPFCPSRCYYCSFVSTTIEKQKKFVEPYIDALVKEINSSLKLINDLGKKVHSVYVGGGTPTSISDEQFNRVLGAITVNDVEFTVEAGRPETISKNKLEIMKRHGVTRISVNPQSLNEEVLKISGRGHTLGDFYNSFDLASKYGFVINTDLIAGLKSETVESFLMGLEKLVTLKPHNITVHTLSQKRGSVLKDESPDFVDSEFILAEKMLDETHKRLKEALYVPYYLYRQKLMLANLENAGYSLPSFQCVNNITTMEETLSVVACGAGAISKRVVYEKDEFGVPNTRIERFANIKDIKLYLEQFNERLLRKSEWTISH